MAGHSKWANIKHKKARMDAKKGKAWSKCARAIIVAAKNGGGDPDTNLTLRYAIDEAKAVNMPKDTIEKAIAKGTGDLGGEAYEQVIYEGYAAGGVAVMLDCLTDNRNRTVPELRKLFEKYGGNLGESGCVAYNFQNKGQVLLEQAGTDEETVMSIALEAGAEDVREDEDLWEVVCEPGDFLAVRDALKNAGLTIESAQITMIPNSTVSVSGRDAEKVVSLIDGLEDHDDVQKVHANFEIPDEQMAAMEE